MIKETKVFDCTIREAGYQTGWYFNKDFVRDVYKFAMGKGIDYIELGFFHNTAHDPDRGGYRYCSAKNDEIREVFEPIKNVTKISAMRDIQRPLSELLPKNQSIVDAVRILTRSHETDLKILKRHVDEVRDLGYEVFVNFTSAGYNSMDRNKDFAEFVKENNVQSVYFADTESVMTPDYVIKTIDICHDLGLKVGMHFHNKNGTAELLADTAISKGVDYIDGTQLGLGGKWRDGNLSIDYILNKMHINGGYELTRLKNELIEQFIMYKDFSTAE